MKYFYIITFDRQIIELEHTPEKVQYALKAWKEGDLLIFKDLEMGIHASSISKIMNEKEYDKFTYTTNFKMYVKDGTWYDTRERKAVYHEDWKQERVESSKPKQIEEPDVSKKEIDSRLKTFKPEFLKKRESIKDKLKV